MTVKITTATGAEMLRSVTPIYNNDDLALAIFEANGKAMHEVGVLIESLKTEMFPQNATWTLGMWEYSLGIKTNKNLPDSTRVQNVLFELNKYFTITRKRMEIIVNTFVEHENAVVEEVDGEYAFIVIIPVSNKIRRGLRESVEETKPAHLLAIYELLAVTGNITIIDDSYTYPVYYKTTGEFSGEKEFTKTDIGEFDVYDDSYDYLVEHPVAEKSFSQQDLTPISVVDDSYDYIKRFQAAGELETPLKGFTQLNGSEFVRFTAYNYEVTLPVCGEFYAEGDGIS